MVQSNGCCVEAKSKQRDKQHRTRYVLGFVGLLLFLAITFCIIQFIPRRNISPFFADISNYQDIYSGADQDAKNLLLEHLTLGQSNRNEVERFIEAEILVGVGYIPSVSTVQQPYCDYETLTITCVTPLQAMFSGDYDLFIRFHFNHENILREISVSVHWTGL